MRLCVLQAFQFTDSVANSRSVRAKTEMALSANRNRIGKEATSKG
jgi:hypothetical protein